MTTSRSIIRGINTSEAFKIISKDIVLPGSMESIENKAKTILERSIDPKDSPKADESNGLLYGLIQSGKTSIITITTALATDNGFDFILILTSDINLLYEQTKERIKEALRGVQVLGKDDCRDKNRFETVIKNTPFVIVCSKNVNRLNDLYDTLRALRYPRQFATLIIDDEADQASLNTYTNKGNGEISRINAVISNLRRFFPLNTYLQVTATPQALFLQSPNHRYRPSFTVLSDPGEGYIGGNDFFGEKEHHNFLRDVNINEVNLLQSTNQPSPTVDVPEGLKKALIAFIVGATIKEIKNGGGNYSFLCHVSMKRLNHNIIVVAINRYIQTLIDAFKDENSSKYRDVLSRISAAYADFKSTEGNLPSIEDVIIRIRFFVGGTNVKEINSETSEEIKLEALYNIFVGGNKLGRGVTIKNLIVSYYGRNPKKPNSDTVLQHARMYGYRQKNRGVTRLFLPEQLANNYKEIHHMEVALRELVNKHPEGKFEGLYISSPLNATRGNVLDPETIGMYMGGKYYNPRFPLRKESAKQITEWFDNKLQLYDDKLPFHITSIDMIKELILKSESDSEFDSELWNKKNLVTALDAYKSIKGKDFNTAYIRVKRNRGLETPRRETQGIHDSDEIKEVPKDAPVLFLHRINESKNGIAAWWPMLLFPEGNYIFAFSFRDAS
jgi:hypothetical protein